MKIAIDISPLKSGHFLQHRVRGTGFYLTNLKKSLLEYYPQHSYHFFTQGEGVPENVDVVHVPYFEPFFLTVPKKTNTKLVLTIHDLTPLVFPKEFPSGVKGKLRWLKQKRRVRQVDRIITDSHSSKKDIEKYIGVSPDRIDVVYLAAADHFKQISLKQHDIEKMRNKYNLPEKFVLYVGDATWNKNLPRLLDAVEQADVPLVLAGSALKQKDIDIANPWNKDLILVQKKISQSNKIQALGFVPDEDLVMIYNMATVFTMPSLYEGFGLPVLEAMSCGTPVVTSKEGSLAEVAGDAAHYVDAHSTDSIASGLSEVFSSDSVRSELAKRGREQADKFSWRETARKTVEAYEKTLNT